VKICDTRSRGDSTPTDRGGGLLRCANPCEKQTTDTYFDHRRDATSKGDERIHAIRRAGEKLSPAMTQEAVFHRNLPTTVVVLMRNEQKRPLEPM
jgi:hypothetical protein